MQMAGSLWVSIRWVRRISNLVVRSTFPWVCVAMAVWLPWCESGRPCDLVLNNLGELFDGTGSHKIHIRSIIMANSTVNQQKITHSIPGLAQNTKHQAQPELQPSTNFW